MCRRLRARRLDPKPNVTPLRQGRVVVVVVVVVEGVERMYDGRGVV